MNKSLITIIVIACLCAGFLAGYIVSNIDTNSDQANAEPANVAWLKPDNTPIVYTMVDSTSAVIFGLEEGGNVKWQFVKVGQ